MAHIVNFSCNTDSQTKKKSLGFSEMSWDALGCPGTPPKIVGSLT